MAPTSALFLLTLALLQLSSCFAQDHSYQGASVADQTKTALLDWKDHLASQGSIFSNDSRFHSWTNNGSMCRDWVGIYCNLAGDLDILIAIGEDLRGTLPAQLSVATGLTGILLKENSFHGSLPPQWSVLTNMLSFDLNRNQITGSLPGVWRHLDRLESLQLRNNQLVTTLPASWSSMQNLYFLDLSQNAQVTGRLPNLWSSMESLLWLDIQGSSITGTLPPSWNSGMTTLERLDLRGSRQLPSSGPGQGRPGGDAASSGKQQAPICDTGLHAGTRLGQVALIDPCP
eukprot:jgi/Tetstr1/431364/TSEL_021055.t1